VAVDLVAPALELRDTDVLDRLVRLHYEFDELSELLLVLLRLELNEALVNEDLESGG